MSVDYTERRALNKGMGDGFSRAMDLAITPVLSGVLGYALDRWLGIVPVFTLVMFTSAVVWLFVRIWREYDAEMQRQESERPT